MKKRIENIKAIFTPQNSILISAFINTAYAIFNFFVGWINDSPWFLSVGGYYLLLCLIRFFILKKVEKASKKAPDQRIQYELKIYRAVGVIMFLVNIAMSVMAVQMIWQNSGSVHSEIMTIAIATFTFYYLTTAIINLQKYRKTEQPIHSAAKMLNFACALMSIFTLQSSMISVFGNDEVFRKQMNIATGCAVFILVFGLAIYMIRRANKLLKINKDDNNG
ncbi:MAG: cation transporter [Clostridia bacterium]|nr:cation transporter [Clostridia bacterium]